HQRNVTLGAKFDEVRGFQRALRKQNSVVADNSYGVTKNARETAYHGRAVERFELVKPTRIDDAVNDIPHVVGFFQILGDDVLNLLWIMMWIFTIGHLPVLSLLIGN